MINLKEVCGTDDELSVILLGGEVIRYHTEGRQLEKQMVSDHTWRVMVILLHLFPDASRQLLLTALYHDVAECYTGDLAAPLKRSASVLAAALRNLQADFHQHLGLPLEEDLTEEEHTCFKVADTLEAYITSSQQNTRYAQVVAGRALGYAFGHARDLSGEIYTKINRIVNVFGQHQHGEGKK